MRFRLMSLRRADKARSGYRLAVEALEDRTVPATLPTGFTEAAVATGLSSATAMEFAPNGDLWVLQQGGTVKRFRPGSTTADVVGTLSGLSTSGERGLLGIAFDPMYASSKTVYLYHTTTSPNTHNRISSFVVNNTNPADYFFLGTTSGGTSGTPTGTTVFELDTLSSATNHNGGAIHFGPDDKLWVAVGDNATGSNAQTLGNLHGKMLRINKNGSIPMDNPFYNTATNDERAIWALGLRNPFTFAFQPGTNRLFINDVGQDNWEEINDGVAGSNYGWPGIEGNAGNAPTSPGTYKGPLYTYSHGSDTFQGYAITGGAFYNPATQQFPSSYTGNYFFADYVRDWINVINLSTNTVTRFATTALGAVDLRVTGDGSLYYLARDSSQVFRVVYTASVAPNITQEPATATVSQTGTANFTVAASGEATLNYQWQKFVSSTWTNVTNGGRVSGATSNSLAITNVQNSDAGQYRAVVTNGFGADTSTTATLTVTANQPPAPTITVNSGLTNGKFIAGQEVAFSGVATDAEDGSLGAASFTWRVDYITSIDSGNPVVRPFLPDFSNVTASTFTPATTGPYTLTDVAYRITLTVTDSGGISSTITRDIDPTVSRLTVATSPAGLEVTVDGQPFTGPHAFDAVVGFERPIGTNTPQSFDGVPYNLASWSDGGLVTHTITTPANNTTYTALFVADAANDPPTLDTPNALTINEDAPAQTIPLTGISAGAPDETGQILTVTALSSDVALIPHPTVNYTSPNGTGTLTLAPIANAFGTAAITVTVNDGGPTNNTTSRTFTVTITGLNDPPTLDAPNPVTLNEDAPAHTINLSGIQAGAANESGQTLTVTAQSSNAAIIPHPTVNYTNGTNTGTLTFTPAANANTAAAGAVTITVTVNDGQPLNNTLMRAFPVAIQAVNDAPTILGTNPMTLNEDAPTVMFNLTGISAGGGETQSLTVTATSNIPGLIPNPVVTYTSPNATAGLKFTPAPDAFGTATITITVNDGQPLNNTATSNFQVTVLPVNDLPTLNPLNPVTMNEDATAQTIPLTGISAGPGNEAGQTIAVTAVSSDPELVPNPVVSYTSPNGTGTITAGPLPDAHGTATITVTVNDGQPLNNTVSRNFTVTVSARNDPPTLDSLNAITLNEDAPTQTVSLSGLTGGPANESQTLTVTAISTTPALLPNPTVTYTSPQATGTLTFTPEADSFGSVTITVTVNDGAPLNNTASQSFAVTITPQNDPPTLGTVNNVTINEDSAATTISLGGITAGPPNETQPLTVTALSSNPTLIPNPTITYTSPDSTAALTFAPLADASGVATITVTANDGGPANNMAAQTFTVTVTPVNDAPTINALSDQTINQDAPPQSVNLSGISAGPNESQALTVTALSNNQALIPNPTLTYASPSSAGTLIYMPAASASGSTTLTVTVNDGAAVNNTTSSSFKVAVAAAPGG